MGKRNKETANLFLSHLSTAMLLFAVSLSALTGYSLLLKQGQFGLPRRRHAVADCQGCINRKLEKDWSQVLNPGALRCVVGFLIYVSAAGPNIFPLESLSTNNLILSSRQNGGKTFPVCLLFSPPASYRRSRDPKTNSCFGKSTFCASAGGS